MKRLFTTVLTSLIFCITVTTTTIFSTQASFAFPILAETDFQSNPFMDKLETDILPELEAILNPEQKTAFSAALETGNLRKALEAATLTTEQKEQVNALVKASLKNKFSSFSPTEKQKFFVNQKAAFLKDKDQFLPDLSTMNDKKKGFMPDLSAINERKKTFMPDLSAINEKKQSFKNLPQSEQE